MRHNTAYTFTNEERRLLSDLLYKRIVEILDANDGSREKMSEKDKAEYEKLYNLYLQF